MAIQQRGDFGFNRMLLQSNKAKVTLPRWIGITAKNHFLLGFRKNGGQTDDSKGGWENRKKNEPGKRRGILVKSGALRNSIAVLMSNWNKILIGTAGIRYARIHNEGLMGRAFGKYSFRMPKREFIGDSEELTRKIKAKIEQETKKIFFKK